MFEYSEAMAGSSQLMENWGEAFGVLCWLWVFSRVRADGPVILGWRHPWDHEEDPFAASSSSHGGHHAPSTSEELKDSWDKFTNKAVKPGEDDDDDDDDEDDE